MPEGLVFFGDEEELKKALEQKQMAITEFRQSVDRMIDEMSADHCHTLYRILVHVSNNDTANTFLIGQLAYVMRKVHKICAGCGGNHAEVDHELAQMTKPEKKDFDEFRSLQDVLDAFNLILVDEDAPTGEAKCMRCDTIYKDVSARVEQGEECPTCKWHDRNRDE